MIFSEQIINYTMKFNNEIIFIKLFDYFKLKHRAEFKKKLCQKISTLMFITSKNGVLELLKINLNYIFYLLYLKKIKILNINN